MTGDENVTGTSYADTKEKIVALAGLETSNGGGDDNHSPSEKEEAADQDFEEMLNRVKEMHRQYEPNSPLPEKIQYIRRAWGLNRLFNSIIVFYFAFKCIEAQWPDSFTNTFTAIESTFGVIFIIDVIIMISAYWPYKYWMDPWNIFDFVVVLVTILDFANIMNGRGFIVLRIFRVFDTLKQHRDFKVLSIATFNSMHKAGFLFLGLFMLMSMYSILGVRWFRQAMPDHFGTYDKALFTMLQVLTGDSWSSVIARSAMDDKYVIAYVFFMSYIVFLAIILMNVVQAVFLDSYLTAHIAATEEIEQRKMRDLFDIFDKDNSGEISKAELEEMCDLLERFGFSYDPTLMFNKMDTRSTFNVMDSDGMISFDEFLNGKKKTEELKEVTLEKINAKLEMYMRRVDRQFAQLFEQLNKITEVKTLDHEREVE